MSNNSNGKTKKTIKEIVDEHLINPNHLITEEEFRNVQVDFPVVGKNTDGKTYTEKVKKQARIKTDNN